MLLSSPLTLLTLGATTLPSTSAKIIWGGRANRQTSSAFLENWSWSNQVGPYQYYIHGPSPVSDYVNLDAAYKNPADKGSKRGFQITIDETSNWNGQTMFRTELIPQTKAKINEGLVYYHFSVQHAGGANAPSPTEEHQVAFFESHFTELKFGGSGIGNKLHWYVGGQSQWSVDFEAGVWHNVVYEIDFDKGSVTFYHSTGGDQLVKTAGPVSATTFSDGQDWHVGVLKLPGSGAMKTEDWHFSGVYIEKGALTTSVSGPGAAKAKQ